MNLDIVNGVFEALGSVAIWCNVRQLLKDKMVRGVNKYVTGFFWSWGLFNLAYYPSLDQWWSFAGGVAICVANFAWLALAIHYRDRDRRAFQPSHLT